MTSLSEKDSFRSIAPEKPVRIGARNFNTTASDKDRYSREKYIPEREVNLQSLSGGHSREHEYSTLYSLGEIAVAEHLLVRGMGLESSANT